MTINSRNQISFFFSIWSSWTCWLCEAVWGTMSIWKCARQWCVRWLWNCFGWYESKKDFYRICFVLEPIGSNKVLEVTLLTKMFWSKLCPLVRKVFRLRVKRHWKVKIFARIKERILSMKVNSFFVLWLKFLQFFVGYFTGYREDILLKMQRDIRAILYPHQIDGQHKHP